MQCTRGPCLRFPPHACHHLVQQVQAGPPDTGRARAIPDAEASSCAEVDKQSGCAGGDTRRLVVQENLQTWGRTATEPAESEMSATSMGSSAVLTNPTVASALAIAGGAPAQRSGRSGESKCVHRAIHMCHLLSCLQCHLDGTSCHALSPFVPAMMVESADPDSIS